MMKNKKLSKEELKRIDLCKFEKIVHYDYCEERDLHTLVTKTKNGVFSEYSFYSELEVDEYGYEYIPCIVMAFGIEGCISTKLFII